MAAIGQALTAPESGWKRYDNKDTNITYGGVSWTDRITTTTNYNSTDHYATKGATIKFNFTGTKLRIIAVISTSMSDNIEINIDGKVEKYSEYSSTTIWQALNYEKTGLFDGEHYVEITNKTSSTSLLLGLDAIDIDSYGEIKPYNAYFPRLAIKNPQTNQHYSLAEKTLIPLPDTSSKNMILHGIKAGKEIVLDEAFDKIQYPVEIDEANKDADGFIVSYKDTIEKPLSIKFE